MMCMQQNVNVILLSNWNCLATEVTVMTESFQMQIHDRALISRNFKPPICKQGLLHCKNWSFVVQGLNYSTVNCNTKSAMNVYYIFNHFSHQCSRNFAVARYHCEIYIKYLLTFSDVLYKQVNQTIYNLPPKLVCVCWRYKLIVTLPVSFQIQVYCNLTYLILLHIFRAVTTSYRSIKKKCIVTW